MILMILLSAVLGLASFVTFVWLVVVAFRRHPGWGVLVLLLSPIAGIVFAVKHWQEAKRPFLATTATGLLSTLLLFGAVGSGVSQMLALSRSGAGGALDEAQIRTMMEGAARQAAPSADDEARIHAPAQDAPAPPSTDPATDPRTAAPSGSAAEILGTGGADPSGPAAPRLTPDGYLVVALAEAQSHLGEPIRVTSRDGSVYRGRLAKADSRILVLERDLGGGSITVELRPSDVREIQVAVN